MKIIVSILLCGSILFSSTRAEEEHVVEVPLQYASALPDCDRIEVYLLDGGVQNEGGEGTFPIRPYSGFSRIKKQVELKGDQAKNLCHSWRSLTFDMWSQAMCHFPIYGLRFYREDKLQFETSVCFGCSNFYFPKKNGESSWHGFIKGDVAGEALIKMLKDTIPIPPKTDKANKAEMATPLKVFDQIGS